MSAVNENEKLMNVNENGIMQYAINQRYHLLAQQYL